MVHCVENGWMEFLRTPPLRWVSNCPYSYATGFGWSTCEFQNSSQPRCDAHRAASGYRPIAQLGHNAVLAYFVMVFVPSLLREHEIRTRASDAEKHNRPSKRFGTTQPLGLTIVGSKYIQGRNRRNHYSLRFRDRTEPKVALYFTRVNKCSESA